MASPIFFHVAPAGEGALINWSIPSNLGEKVCPRAALSAFLCFSFLSLLSERRFPQSAQKLTGHVMQFLPINVQFFHPKMQILHIHMQFLPIVMQFLQVSFLNRVCRWNETVHKVDDSQPNRHW